MNPELWYILLVTSSVGLFALGGTGGWKFGTKAWRRYVLPIVVVVILSAGMGIDIKVALACGGTLCGVLHLGYGDRTSWLVRIGVFASYAAPPIWLVRGRWVEFGVWIGITSVVLTLAFLASRNAKLQWVIKWKVWEMLAGFCIAASFVPHLPS